MTYEFKNQTKEELINNINKSFIEIQKTYKVLKKYYIKPITDIKLNCLNYYSNIDEHTVTHINPEYANLYYQLSNKKPLICIIVSTNINTDKTIDAKIFSNRNHQDLIFNKYNEVKLLRNSLARISTDSYEYNQCLEFCKPYEQRILILKDINNRDILYELNDELTELNYNQDTSIVTKIQTSKIYEYTLIEILIHDRISKRTVFMGRVFHNLANINELLYITIKDGLKNFYATSKSKVNIGESLLRLSAFLKVLGNKKLILKQH